MSSNSQTPAVGNWRSSGLNWLGDPRLFALTTFVSAGLVFMVEPMAARMLLPWLGGSPSVWNTSLAFFQAALLGGYAYAHLLQRLRQVRQQIMLHLVLLVLAALTLPLAISGAMGAPDPSHPILWLLAELTLSLGAPFALLSATAPLVQSWFAQRRQAPGAPVMEAYPLYAASNLGSLAALIAYPVIIEPFSTLSAQRMGWSIGFGLFVVLIGALGLGQRFTPVTRHEDGAGSVETDTPSDAKPSLGRMVVWIALAAAPSSLMLGVTAHLTTDIASFPFLWVAPLALYLITFVLAFSARGVQRRGLWLTLQAISVIAVILVTPFLRLDILSLVGVSLANFFLTALVCHLALADQRPAPAHLTLFYLCLSIGGVVGGSFNAFFAPVAFNTVLEYPLVLVLACLARPWGGWRLSGIERVIVAISIIAGAGPLALAQIGLPSTSANAWFGVWLASIGILGALSILMRDRAVWFTLMIGVLSILVNISPAPARELLVKRSFFGVLKVSEIQDNVLGPVRTMMHGTTLHGAQTLRSETACQPLTYYAPSTSIGQTVVGLQADRPAMNMSVVGLGAGALAAYVRPGDHLRFYEIDPLVVRAASDPHLFTYTTACAATKIEFEVGDARLTLGRAPAGQLDLLVIDAFSSDAVPTHLLTTEALRMYLSRLKPNGVLLVHLTNRRLDLRDTVIAGLNSLGAYSLTQKSTPDPQSVFIAAPTTVVIASQSPAAMARFTADPRWRHRDPGKTSPWTDDYSNLIGPMLAGFKAETR